MTTRSIRNPFLPIVLLGGLAFGGCSDDAEDPCPGVVKGATYDVKIVKTSKEARPAGCQADWGFLEDTVLVATVNETFSSATCSVGIPELSGLSEWSFDLHRTEALSDGFMEGSYQGQFGQCRASVTMSLEAGPGLPCFQSGSGSSAACELVFDLYGLDGEGCPARCTAWLAVDVTRR